MGTAMLGLCWDFTPREPQPLDTSTRLEDIYTMANDVLRQEDKIHHYHHVFFSRLLISFYVLFEV